MKYHLIKNMIIGCLIAMIYWGNLIENLPMVQKIIATASVMASSVCLLTYTDVNYSQKRKKKQS